MPKIIYGNDAIDSNFEVYIFGDIVFHKEILPHVDACIWKSEDQFGFSIYLDNVPDNDETQRAVNLMYMAVESIRAIDGFDVSGLIFNEGKYSYGFMMMCGDMDEYNECNDLFNAITTIHADSEVYQYKVYEFYDYLSDKCDEINDLMSDESSE